jgi:hypothetical protein
MQPRLDADRIAPDAHSPSINRFSSLARAFRGSMRSVRFSLS